MCGEDFGGWSERDDGSIFYEDDVVGPLESRVYVVEGGEGGDFSGGCDLFYLAEDALLVGGVEIGGRLVEEEESRGLGDGSGEADHLPLTFAEL